MDVTLLKVGSALSLIGGILTLLSSNLLDWTSQPFPKSLMVVSGVLMIVAALFMGLFDRTNHFFWGITVLFSSPFSLLAIGMAGTELIYIQGIISFVLGVMGGALGIASKERRGAQVSKWGKV
jgi:hypothetical protein